MAGTPGVIQDGQKYIAEMETQAAAESVDYDAAVQALSIEALGGNVNKTAEIDLGLVSNLIVPNLNIEAPATPNYAAYVAVGVLIYFLFIKKGKLK